MIGSTRPCAVPFALALVAWALWLPPVVADAELTGNQLLERAGEAYQALPALEDTLTLEIELPRTAPGQRILHLGLGEGSDLSLRIVGSRRLTTLGDRLYVETESTKDRYFETAFDGDLVAALDALWPVSEVEGLPFRSAGLWPPVQAALRSGQSSDTVLEAFRLTPLLETLTIAGVETLDDGSLELRLEAGNGHCRARFDGESFLLASVDYLVRPRGLSAEFEIRMHGRYDPRSVSADDAVGIDPAGRPAVDSLRGLRPQPPGIEQPPAERITSETFASRLMGRDQLVEALRSERVVLVGEDHLLVEPPRYMTALMEALDDRPIRLFLELPADAQPAIDRYLGTCDAQDLRAVFAGRQVLPIHDILAWACAHPQRVERVAAMDEPLVEILLRRMFLSDTRNETMAQAMAADYRDHPGSRIMAYAGQMHMLKAGRYRLDDPSREPVGSRLLGLGVPEQDIASVMLSGGDRFHLHEIWSEAGVAPLSGQLVEIPYPYFIDYPIFGVEHASEIFDYFVNLGTLTPIDLTALGMGEK